MTPAVCGREAADSLELGLALLVAGEELQDRAQVREVEQRQPGLVAVVEDQPQRGLLRLVEPEHLGEQRRPEGRHRHSHRYADALATDRVELRREAVAVHVCPTAAVRAESLSLGLAGYADAGQVTLDVGGEDRHPVGAELLGQQLQGLGLAGAGRAGDEAVAVEHAERDPDADVAEVVGVQHQPTELERRRPRTR